jgi:hypothetical protein
MTFVTAWPAVINPYRKPAGSEPVWRLLRCTRVDRFVSRWSRVRRRAFTIFTAAAARQDRSDSVVEGLRKWWRRFP